MSNYLSVSEYAKLHGKDVGNIRRLLAAGRLEGEKIGNQWIIPENAAFPADKRVTTGEFCNWRKRVALNKHKDLVKTISNMIVDLRGIYGDLLKEVIIHGSYAKGTENIESDVDIAIVLNDKPSKDMTDSMVNCVSSYELECGKVLSVIDIDSNMFESWKDVLPFYKNIQKDGITLWKAAV